MEIALHWLYNLLALIKLFFLDPNLNLELRTLAGYAGANRMNCGLSCFVFDQFASQSRPGAPCTSSVIKLDELEGFYSNMCIHVERKRNRNYRRNRAIQYTQTWT